MSFTESMLSIYIAVATFTILAQPAGAQEANATLSLTYPGQVLQGDGSQTCPSEERLEILRSQIDNATRILVRETVVPLLQGYSCGGYPSCKATLVGDQLAGDV